LPIQFYDIYEDGVPDYNLNLSLLFQRSPTFPEAGLLSFTIFTLHYKINARMMESCLSRSTNFRKVRERLEGEYLFNQESSLLISKVS